MSFQSPTGTAAQPSPRWANFRLTGRALALLLHPDGLTLGANGGLSGTVTEAVFQGDSVQISLTANGVPLAFKCDSRQVSRLPRPGEPIQLAVNPAYILPLKD